MKFQPATWKKYLPFTLCLNPIAWWLLSVEGYTYSHNKQEKLTHLLYVDDLKTYHKSAQKALLRTKTAKSMFEDIGLFWGLDKCATINIVRGKLQTNEENVSIFGTEELKVLDTDDYYKFLSKYENSVQLEQQVCNEATSEYLERLSVISLRAGSLLSLSTPVPRRACSQANLLFGQAILRSFIHRSLFLLGINVC